jgi:hypothetical protein
VFPVNEAESLRVLPPDVGPEQDEQIAGRKRHDGQGVLRTACQGSTTARYRIALSRSR